MKLDIGDTHQVSLFVLEFHINLSSKTRSLHARVHHSLVLFATYFSPSWIKVVLDESTTNAVEQIRFR